MIAEYDNTIASFFIIERVKDYENLPRFKGILTAVKKEHRGQKLHLAMQSHLYKHLGIEKFYLDNTTQLSNMPVIKNHIKSNRRLHQMSLTMMLKKEMLQLPS